MSHFKKLLLLLAFVALPACGQHPGEMNPGDAGADFESADSGHAAMRLLFVGDSYTYVNDLPSMVRDVIASAPGSPSLAIDSVAIGGATFQMHYQVTGALERIRSGDFTHVILQGQSVEPLMPVYFLPFGAKLGQETRQRGAAPVYFETWARAPGDAVYQETWSGGDPAGMQKGLRDGYLEAAKEGGGTVAPVGDAWERALARMPAPALHDVDGSHPTKLGSYLAACIFYRRLVGKNAAGLGGIPAGVSAEQAALAQQVADEVTLP